MAADLSNLKPIILKFRLKLMHGCQYIFQILSKKIKNLN